MRTPLQARNQLLITASNLIGLRMYGNVIEPALLMLPDPNLGDGIDFPQVINGSPVTYLGIEVVFYRYQKSDTRSHMFAGQLAVTQKSWVLIKDHGNIKGLTLAEINEYRDAAGLDPITEEQNNEALSLVENEVFRLFDLVRKLPPEKPFLDGLLDSSILEVDYAGAM